MFNRSSLIRLASLVCLICLSAIGQAAVDPYAFQSTQQQNDFLELTQNLRCLVCQNENLASSNSRFAADMRHEIYSDLQAGKSKQAIQQDIIARYGQFISFQPAWNPETYLLWGLPLLLSGLALGIGYRIYRKYRMP